MPGTWCESVILSDNSPSSFKKYSEIIHSPIYAKKEKNCPFIQPHSSSKCNFCTNLMPRKTNSVFLFFFYSSLPTFGFVLPAFSSFPRHTHTLSADTSPLWEKIELQGSKKNIPLRNKDFVYGMIIRKTTVKKQHGCLFSSKAALTKEY